MNESQGINVRSPRFLLALTVSSCPHCGSPTALLGIAVPPGHETLDPDDEPSDDEPRSAAPLDSASVPATWSVAHHNAFLFYVDFLPVAVQSCIQQLVPAYRPADGGSANGGCWANHCESCGVPLDDHELFCEPEGAFLPTSEARAVAIHLVNVDQPFEAAAGGYAPEPPHFDAVASS